MAIALKHQNALVLGADTIVVIDGIILGKPANKTQAKNMLEKLSGREHKVFTGFTIAHLAIDIHETKVIQSTVRFKTISTDEMNWYIACDEPYDKAGGYAIQGKGAYFIQSIRGSYTNVIGLPLCEVLQALKKYKMINFR
jgi:septum formation protein